MAVGSHTVRIWSLPPRPFHTGEEAVQCAYALEMDTGHMGVVGLELLDEHTLICAHGDGTIQNWSLHEPEQESEAVSLEPYDAKDGSGRVGRLEVFGKDRRVERASTSMRARLQWQLHLDGAFDACGLWRSTEHVRLLMGGAKGAVVWVDVQARRAPDARALGDMNSGVVLARFAPDGTRAATACRDRRIAIWRPTEELAGDDTTGAWRVFDDAGGEVWALSFSHVGTHLAAGGIDNGVYLWDLRAKNALRAVSHDHDGWISDLAWSEDDRVLASASWDNTVGLFRAGDLMPLFRFEYHEDYVSRAIFVPGSTFLISASYDRSIAVWDWHNASLVTEFDDHTDWIQAMQWAGDGVFVSASSDRTMRLWSSTALSAEVIFGEGSGDDWLSASLGTSAESLERASRTESDGFTAVRPRSSPAVVDAAIRRAMQATSEASLADDVSVYYDELSESERPDASADASSSSAAPEDAQAVSVGEEQEDGEGLSEYSVSGEELGDRLSSEGSEPDEQEALVEPSIAVEEEEEDASEQIPLLTRDGSGTPKSGNSGLFALVGNSVSSVDRLSNPFAVGGSELIELQEKSLAMEVPPGRFNSVNAIDLTSIPDIVRGSSVAEVVDPEEEGKEEAIPRGEPDADVAGTSREALDEDSGEDAPKKEPKRRVSRAKLRDLFRRHLDKSEEQVEYSEAKSTELPAEVSQDAEHVPTETEAPPTLERGEQTELNPPPRLIGKESDEVREVEQGQMVEPAGELDLFSEFEDIDIFEKLEKERDVHVSSPEKALAEQSSRPSFVRASDLIEDSESDAETSEVDASDAEETGDDAVSVTETADLPGAFADGLDDATSTPVPAATSEPHLATPPSDSDAPPSVADVSSAASDTSEREEEPAPSSAEEKTVEMNADAAREAIAARFAETSDADADMDVEAEEVESFDFPEPLEDVDPSIPLDETAQLARPRTNESSAAEETVVQQADEADTRDVSSEVVESEAEEEQTPAERKEEASAPEVEEEQPAAAIVRPPESAPRPNRKMAAQLRAGLERLKRDASKESSEPIEEPAEDMREGEASDASPDSEVDASEASDVSDMSVPDEEHPVLPDVPSGGTHELGGLESTRASHAEGTSAASVAEQGATASSHSEDEPKPPRAAHLDRSGRDVEAVIGDTTLPPSNLREGLEADSLLEEQRDKKGSADSTSEMPVADSIPEEAVPEPQDRDEEGLAEKTPAYSRQSDEDDEDEQEGVASGSMARTSSDELKASSPSTNPRMAPLRPGDISNSGALPQRSPFDAEDVEAANSTMLGMNNFLYRPKSSSTTTADTSEETTSAQGSTEAVQDATEEAPEGFPDVSEVFTQPEYTPETPEFIDVTMAEIWHMRMAERKAAMKIFKRRSNSKHQWRSYEQIDVGLGRIFALHYSQELDYIAAGGARRHAELWSMKRGRLYQLPASGRIIYALTATSDGRVLMAGDDKANIHVWLLPRQLGEDPEATVARAVLKGHVAPISGLATNSTGKLLLSSSLDGTARLWSMEDGECLAVLEHNGEPLTGGAFWSKGIVTISHEGTLRLWDRRGIQIDQIEGFASLTGVDTHRSTIYASTQRGEVIRYKRGATSRMTPHDGAAVGVGINPDGALVSVGQEGRMQVFYDDEDEPMLLDVGETLNCVYFGSDLLLVGTADGKVEVFRRT